MATFDETSPFQCCICFNSKEGRQPRALPCQHSFCNECLQEWHQTSQRGGHCAGTQVECPTCRTMSTLPSGDVSSLPMDINLQQFSEFFNKDSRLFCQVCNIKRGKLACTVCFAFLCEDCGDKHRKSPLFASHKLSRHVCERHGMAVTGVCTTCLCGVCLQCVNEDLHKDHCLEEMSTGIENFKRNIRKHTEILQDVVRKGDMEMSDKRHFIKQFSCTEKIKGQLYQVKKEVERLEKEIADHERLCEGQMDAVFEEYENKRRRANAAILNARRLQAEDETDVLEKLREVEIPNENICNQIRTAVSSLPEFNSISLSKCCIEHMDSVLESLKNCQLACQHAIKVPATMAPPVEALKINCGEGCDIGNPWRLSGTPEGDVIVCDYDGGPVYKMQKDGTRTRVHHDGRAACVHGGHICVIGTDGGTLTRIGQDGDTAQYKLIPLIPDPRGIAVSDENVFILTYDAIIKRSFADPDSRETLKPQGFEDLRHLLKIRHEGITKLVSTDLDTHEVIILDEAGAVLTRFGGHGTEDGLLNFPTGISRMSNGHLLVADWGNHRIVEYKMDGTFVRNLLTRSDGLNYPEDVVCKYPYLWIVENMEKRSIKLFIF